MTQNNSNKGFLTVVERLGNKIPDTMALFLALIVIVTILSAVFSFCGITATYPQTGEKVAVLNLLSVEGLLLLLENLVSNFARFPILGVTLVVGIAMGLCEAGGFFAAAIKFGFSKVRPAWIALFVSFTGVFMCSFDGAISHVVVPTLAATIYLAMGKNPLIGVISGYAAAATGDAMEFVPAFWQVALTPLTINYAQILDPGFSMPLMSDSFGMLPASILAVLVNTFVTIRIIEPRFRDYRPDKPFRPAAAPVPAPVLTPEQIRAVKKALCGLLIFVGLVAAACLPAGSFFRGPGGSLVIDAPLMNSFENLLFFLFFIPGFIYAKSTGRIKNTRDLSSLMAEGLKVLLPFIVLVLVISQFLALFHSSNLAKVIALLGGNALAGLQVPTSLILVIFFLAYASINLFIVSGSTKYMIFGAVFVPLFMQMGLHPAFIQFMLRLADGTTNQVSPMNPFFPIVIALFAKYGKKSGVGTAVSALLPYGLGNIIVFLAVLLVFYFFELPLGISGASVWSLKN